MLLLRIAQLQARGLLSGDAGAAAVAATVTSGARPSCHRCAHMATAADAPAGASHQAGSESSSAGAAGAADGAASEQPHHGQQQQPSPSPPQQPQQRPQDGLQRRGEAAAALNSLHQQYLYQQPGPGQPVPRLPRFVARPPEQQPLPAWEALRMVQASARTRFPETVEAHVRLRVDPRRGDQMVRGAAVLPHSLGKPLRIAVFAEGAAAEQARTAGADVVGCDDLVASILGSKGKGIDFNACLATPDMMPRLVKLGRILGPKGLMPNPKVGTLTDDLAGAIAELRQGRLEFKMDRGGVVHAPIGAVPFATDALHANMGALAAALLAAKPEAVKGGLAKYVRSVVVCSTQGRGVPVDVASLAAAMDVAAAAMAARRGGPAAQAAQQAQAGA